MRHRYPIIASMLLTAAAAGAQTGDDPAAPPRYNVEIVVFAHTDFDPAEERFDGSFESADASSAGRTAAPIAIEPISPQHRRPAAAMLDQAAAPDPRQNTEAAADAVAVSDALPAAPAADILDFVDPFGTLTPGLTNAADGLADLAPDPVRLLARDELTLADARSVIDRLGAYRLLGYGGWQQPGLDQTLAVPFDLARLGIANPTGTVELYLGRFLHVAIDLTYRAPTPISPGMAPSGRITEAGTATPDRALPPYAARSLADIGLAERFRLKTERNAIRSGELHYIDHPRFGVLVLVTPAPEPEATEDNDLSVTPSA